jgi:hypothetical protein
MVREAHQPFRVEITTLWSAPTRLVQGVQMAAVSSP